MLNPDALSYSNVPEVKNSKQEKAVTNKTANNSSTKMFSTLYLHLYLRAQCDFDEFLVAWN